MRFFLFLTILMLFGEGYAQILNIDRENGQDSVPKKVSAAFSFSFIGDKQRRNVIEITNTSELDIHVKKDRIIIFNGLTDLIFNGGTILENNGFFQLRFRDNDKRKFYPDFFTQYQWNGIQGMEYRALAGVNGRFRFLEKRRSDLYVSIGTFYEAEKWNPFLKSYSFSKDFEDVVYRNLFRLNLTTKFAFKIGKHIDFSGISYVQFPINEFFDSPRWFFDSNLNYEVNKHLSMVVHYDHNLDNYRPLPIENYYYNLSLGFQIRF
ncbi:MAG: hypothetical protein RIT43_1054 [Bacteroidota bacterium]